MAFAFKEQIVYDHIRSNPHTRDLWVRRIGELRTQRLSDDQIANIIEEDLRNIYSQLEEARSDIEAFVDTVDLMLLDYRSIAFKLLGIDLVKEAEKLIETERLHKTTPSRIGPVPIFPNAPPSPENIARLNQMLSKNRASSLF